MSQISFPMLAISSVAAIWAGALTFDSVRRWVRRLPLFDPSLKHVGTVVIVFIWLYAAAASWFAFHPDLL
jgi:hypothetical protein